MTVTVLQQLWSAWAPKKHIFGKCIEKKLAGKVVCGGSISLHLAPGTIIRDPSVWRVCSIEKAAEAKCSTSR